MSEQEAHDLVVHVARAVASAETLAIGLRMIAGGHWNVGRPRGEDMTAIEYARDVLRVAGLPGGWSS